MDTRDEGAYLKASFPSSLSLFAVAIFSSIMDAPATAIRAFSHHDHLETAEVMYISETAEVKYISESRKQKGSRLHGSDCVN
eukprot:2518865-Pyramimonas_sp.AAC.1